jgi:hypothetical protein
MRLRVDVLLSFVAASSNESWRRCGGVGRWVQQALCHTTYHHLCCCYLLSSRSSLSLLVLLVLLYHVELFEILTSCVVHCLAFTEEDSREHQLSPRSRHEER